FAPPDPDSLLGDSVTENDRTFMELPVPDPYFVQGGGGGGSELVNGSGVSVDIAARAVRGTVIKRFRLIYRRRVRFQRCTADAPAADASFAALTQTEALSDAGAAVDLSTKQDVTFDLRIEPEAVFRDDVNPTSAALRFDPFASADVDGDGQ